MKKIQEHHTDFLFTTPTFLTGAATVFNIAGGFYEYNSSESESEADCLAISNDFNIVGGDLKNVLSKHDLLVK